MRRFCLLVLLTGLMTAGCGKELTSSETQPVPEAFDRVVLSELFTSYTCTNCPEAEAALDRLYDEETASRHAVIHWHYSDPPSWPDPFSIAVSKERYQAYLGKLGATFDLPGCVFDGIDIIKGGSVATYGEYRSRFDSEIALQSALQITLTPAISASDLHVDVGVAAMPDTSFASLELMVVVVEHETPNPWGEDPPVFSFVARTTDAQSVSVTGGADLDLDVDFTLDASWATEHLHVVAFLQEPDYGEVLQAAITTATVAK